MNTAAKVQMQLPDINILLKGMPPRKACKCGKGLPEVSFDFTQRTWFVWCGCSQSSSDMKYLDHAILDFNTKNKK
ncbi:MAG: hypothetical protein OEX07_15540 [Gammaproteobacteria bacterium]|nr:hypothetical protein [Gammaproteobacteria bacterium]